MKISNRLLKPKIFSKNIIKPYPYSIKMTEKFKLFKVKPSVNYNIFPRRNSQDVQSSRLGKSNSIFHQTSFGSSENINALPKLKLLNIRKKGELKVRKLNSINFNTINKAKNLSQGINKSEFIENKNEDIFDIKLEKETINKKEKSFNVDLNNTDINEIIDNIIKEYSDIGKIIKVCFFIDQDRIIEYKKNEYVILKIIEKDLKDNYGLDIKEFIFNNKKLNEFKSLKDNNIVNNSIIKVII